MKDSLSYLCVIALLAVRVGSVFAERVATPHHTKSLVKSSSIPTKSIEIAALGRVARLGDLYDARNDNFLDVSLYTSDVSRNAVYSTDKPSSSISYVRTESYREKLEKLDVSESLSVSFLGGMVKPSGSWNYLNEDKKTSTSAKTSLIYSIRTVREDLQIFSKSSTSLFDKYLLENIDATHVVIGTEWGASVVVSLEATNIDPSNKQDAQRKLEEILDLIALSISGSAKVDLNSAEKELNGTARLHVNSDITLSTVPQTINDAVTFMKQLPTLIKNGNSGKGEVMKYILMPFQTVQRLFQVQSNSSGIVRDVGLNRDLTDELVRIFQKMKDSELQINDVYNAIRTWNLIVPVNDFANISMIKSGFHSYSKDFRMQLADLVIRFRSGELDDEVLAELTNAYENGIWTSEIVDALLEEFTLTMRKIRLLELFQSFKAKFIDRGTDKYKILADNYENEIRMISIDLSRVNISSPYVQRIVKLLQEESGKDSGAIPCYIEDAIIDIPVVDEYLEGNVINSIPIGQNTKDQMEYIFLSDITGKVIIIDANSYEQITTYNMPEISMSIVAIVNGKFYNIDTLNGIIKSTSMEKIMAPDMDKNWAQVGCFPIEENEMLNSAAVNGSVIFFVTNSGYLYAFDTVLNSVTKLDHQVYSHYYAPLIVVNNVLYIHVLEYFYSFDGDTLREIRTPEHRYHVGLFQFGNLVCRVGGNTTDVYPDPVSCYNPSDGTWTTSSYINHHRRYPGITSTTSGTYIFGGLDFHPQPPAYWLNSTEFFNPKTKTWSYIQSPLTGDSEYVRALTFFL